MKMTHILVGKFRNRLLPVEMVLAGYLLFTGLIILFDYTRLDGAHTHLIIRMIILGVILFIANPKWKQRFLPLRVLWPLVMLPYLYSETDYLNNIFFHHNLDPFFSRLEYVLFQTQPALEFSEKLQYDGFAELMYMGYISYYLMILVIPLTLYIQKKQEYLERTTFILVHTFMVFYIVYIFIPTGGPQFQFPGSATDLPGGYVFGPLLKSIQRTFEGATAAFPSSHVSICLILVWISYLHTPRLFYILLPVSIILMFSTVYIKAHYVIDVMSGILVTPFLYLFSETIYDFLVHGRLKVHFLRYGEHRKHIMDHNKN